MVWASAFGAGAAAAGAFAFTGARLAAGLDLGAEVLAVICVSGFAAMQHMQMPHRIQGVRCCSAA
jgi:hypothetical protein